MKRIFTFFLLLALAAGSAYGKVYTLSSPDGRTFIEVNVQQQITWRVTHNRQPILAPSAISMTVPESAPTSARASNRLSQLRSGGRRSSKNPTISSN